ncbi:hypothetical protein E9536_14570 [Burkholderia sp. LS-044]|nr:hypothetical protein [Burkholderia sp. HAN2018]THJ53503.1 hypothetical protein E9536_14570 [Burkholderia sp. LS-044]
MLLPQQVDAVSKVGREDGHPWRATDQGSKHALQRPRHRQIGPHAFRILEVRDSREPNFLPSAARRVGISFQPVEGTRFEIFPEML